MSEQRQRVRFTGKRTGRDDMPIPQIGLVSRGDVIEVSLDEADRWTTPLPSGDGKDAADFVKVGGSIKVDEDDANARTAAQREKISKRADKDDENAPDVPLAHESDPDTGTVEEFAAEVADAESAEVQKKA